MKTQTLNRPVSSVPFTLSFVERLDPALYDQAIQDSEVLKQSYDPKTQTSNIPVSANDGTSLTYSDTFSGFLLPKDDAEQSDT